MQKFVLFVEPNDDAFMTPEKIGDMFMNRFAIDENASCEILKKFELGKTSLDMAWSKGKDYKNFVEERKQKGMDRFIVIADSKILMGYIK